MDEAEQRSFDELKAKVGGLEEQVTRMVKPEEHQKVLDEHQKVKAELDGIRVAETAKVKAAEDAAKATKEQALTTKRIELIKKGLPEDKVKGMDENALAAAELVVTSWKPGADMGGGSGGSSLQGLSRDVLIQMAYGQKN